MIMERQIFSKLVQHLDKKAFTILIGARQVGKTTVLKQLYKLILSEKKSAFYLSFEDPAILTQINEHPENIFRFVAKPVENNGVIYVFIDEVQYAHNPSNLLKYLYDTYAPSLKILATGSSAFYIDQKFQDSLAGRKTIFELFPLNFEEFLLFKNKEDLISDFKLIKSNPTYISTQINTFKLLLEEYMQFGSYPAVVLAESVEDKIAILKELKNSFLKKDILESEIENEEKFYRLLTILASQIGQMLNQHELANTLKLNEKTLSRYIFILQKCFHIQLVKPYFNNIRKELTKMPNAYFNDLGLRNCLLNQFGNIFERTDKGEILENLVYSLLRDSNERDTIKYWRTADNNEVDFVVETSFNQGKAFEVKWSENAFSVNKYKKFTENYINFPLKPLTFDFKNSESFVLKL
jgi:predicted AAA+ superfamily ATPase